MLPTVAGPLVSVVIPAYNAESTVEAAVRSALAQDVDVEVVVVDDGSTDGTPEVLAGIEGIVSDRIPNGGAAAARNRALELASGEIVAFLDADDEWSAGRLTTPLGALCQRPEVDGILTDHAVWDGASILGTGAEQNAARFGMTSGTVMTARMPAMFGALILRRDLVERIGPFDLRYRIHEDVDYWYRVLTARARIVFVPEPTYLYRHNAGKSGSWKKAGADLVRINLRHATARRTPAPLRWIAARRFLYAVLRSSIAFLRRDH